jgi:polyisoprenoid-binding protein YceI
MNTTAATKNVVPAGTWTVDRAHSKAGFAVKHMGIATVRGEFTEFEGTLEVGEDLSSAKAYGTVNVGSVDTNEPGRDEDLRSANFFDIEQYPEMTFESSRIEALDDETLRIVGNLTLHGVTKEIELKAEVMGTDVDHSDQQRLGLEVTGELSRNDFGIAFNHALGSGNLVVSDKVKLAIDVSAIKS